MMVINIHDNLGISKLINLDNVSVMETTVEGGVAFEFMKYGTPLHVVRGAAWFSLSR
ncbi:hypothetical protein ECP02999177_0270 [Escherichia coli P0299917.7]|uniref:hypothetical protein n=1 Tax=Escherichia coli TaxID=562 RepID=UPI0002C8B069|nr:hypothetical protein [Escherichia coli]ENC83683.1 hypothetical protein ECP02999177_0270 [Escherichia coli P0299917.7]